ncbi:hypothetical protein PFUGPA_03742 [Plasmodium falciparum Palo Alto/Uganda]|uniref:Uncharacterized protein n=1 Tax=Plasmodium falciparum (isolate Palo Alto / Uganda) TaxID=57270 RepID=W4IVL9_PLAFP|nr:hypothetical protein PFUGPA_03742 [Plasmodium falciparum Palo Alto/Uganda]
MVINPILYYIKMMVMVNFSHQHMINRCIHIKNKESENVENDKIKTKKREEYIISKRNKYDINNISSNNFAKKENSILYISSYPYIIT